MFVLSISSGLGTTTRINFLFPRTLQLPSQAHGEEPSAFKAQPSNLASDTGTTTSWTATMSPTTRPKNIPPSQPQVASSTSSTFRGVKSPQHPTSEPPRTLRKVALSLQGKSCTLVQPRRTHPRRSAKLIIPMIRTTSMTLPTVLNQPIWPATVTSPNRRLHPSGPHPHRPIVDPIDLHRQACPVFPTGHAAVNVTASPGRAIESRLIVVAQGAVMAVLETVALAAQVRTVRVTEILRPGNERRRHRQEHLQRPLAPLLEEGSRSEERDSWTILLVFCGNPKTFYQSRCFIPDLFMVIAHSFSGSWSIFANHHVLESVAHRDEGSGITSNLRACASDIDGFGEKASFQLRRHVIGTARNLAMMVRILAAYHLATVRR